MQAQLTEKQIKTARVLRAGGMSYADIKAKLRTDVAPDTIRSHCLDIVVDGKARTRAPSATVTRNGAEVRGFTEAEDNAIIDYLAKPEGERENLNRFAASIERRRHSVAGRIKTLKKLGKLP